MYKRAVQGWLKHLDFILWDVLVLQIAFVLGYMLRHGWKQLPYMIPSYRSLAIILVVVDFLVAVVFDTMHNVLKRGYLKEFYASLKQATIVLVLMALYLFSAQVGDVYSRITIYLTAIGHLLLGYGFRLLWKPVAKKISRDKAKGTMLLVADRESAERILSETGGADEQLFSGVVLSDRDGTGETIHGIRVVSSLNNAADYICREWVDEVFVCPECLSDLKMTAYDAAEQIVADTGRNGAEEEDQNRTGIAKLIDQCREMAVPVHIQLPISASGGKVLTESVCGYDALTLAANWATPRQALTKRLFDILGGIFGSLVALVLIAVIGPVIKKQSPGPVLFRQTRIGQNGKKFTLYKIRSMYMDADERKQELQRQNNISDGMMFKVDFDPRIIGNRIENGKQVRGIGQKIREYSLDEFPQFFNILKGDMSLVGTRPPTEDEWERYKYHHRARLAIKPGLTGLWQVSGRSRITDFEEVVRLDTAYINNWSIALDLRILLKTIRTVLKKDGAM